MIRLLALEGRPGEIGGVIVYQLMAPVAEEHEIVERMYVGRPLASLSPRPNFAKCHDVGELREVSLA